MTSSLTADQIAAVNKIPDCYWHPGTPAEYDAATGTADGPWAYMCPRCFQERGVGLGLGLGQKLVLKTDPPVAHVGTVGGAPGPARRWARRVASTVAGIVGVVLILTAGAQVGAALGTTWGTPLPLYVLGLGMVLAVGPLDEAAAALARGGRKAARRLSRRGGAR